MSEVSLPDVVSVEHLRVETVRGLPIVEDASFAIKRGEVLGLVGESGSGKTTTALALLGYASEGVRISGGSVVVDGQPLTGRSESDVRGIRGRVISYVPQDPSVALNPFFRVERLVSEVLRQHAPERNTRAEIQEALARVQLPTDRPFLRRYPHQLSGGQQQRLTIAMAFACHPAVTVLDEPTTGLDVVTQAHILAEIKRQQASTGTSVVYVSHDLAVVAGIADRIAVMYAGAIVEVGSTEEILRFPRHPYTHGLIASVPDHAHPRQLRGIPGVAVGVGERPVGCRFAARCPLRIDECETRIPVLTPVSDDHEVRCIRAADAPPMTTDPVVRSPLRDSSTLLMVKELSAGYATRDGHVVAAEQISFDVLPGECVALVGESGSGKTTIARAVVGLHRPSEGRVELHGELLAGSARNRTREQRRRMQIVFQNPYDSLNPRHTVESSIRGPMRYFGRDDGRAGAVRLLHQVRLSERVLQRYPSELSGGERQRVAIARALAAGPDLLVCDEITSALDVSVQAAVLELLGALRKELGLGMLFITHDLGVVASVCDRMLVLKQGELCESGPVDRVLTDTDDEYTLRLLDAAPSLPVH